MRDKRLKDMRMRNKRMKRNKAILWIIGGIFLFSGISVLLISTLSGTFKKQVEGEYIATDTVHILMNELEVDSRGVVTQTEEENLTFASYVDILDKLLAERPDVFSKDLYNKFKKEYFAGSYAKGHMILKSDFLKAYFELAALLKPEKEIKESSFLVLGGVNRVFDLNEQSIAEGNVLIADSDMKLSELYWPEYEEAIYHSVDVVMAEGRVVVMLDKKASDFSFEKAWVSSNTEEGLKVNYAGRILLFPYAGEVYSSFEEIVDLTFDTGALKEVSAYDQKVSGKLISVTEDKIELEDVGTYSYSDDLQVYKLYGAKEPYTIEDLKIGYNFTDFILDGETIIAALVTREESMENIRVVIKTNDFADIFHESVSFTPDCDYTVQANGEQKEYKAGEKIELDADNDLFKDGRVKIIPKALTGNIAFNSIQRSQGTPKYRGFMEIQKTDGGLVVINELLLEEYLYSVVPSEMPSSYPIEALKAQAVSARTYAYRNMQKSALPQYGAHVDDSVSYQVYNNIAISEAATLAVRETTGQVVTYQGKLAETYYYSTSCGYSTDLSAWGNEVTPQYGYLKSKHIGTESGNNVSSDVENTEETLDNDAFYQMISSKNETDFEKNQDYYRWVYETDLDVDLLLERIKERYNANATQVLTLQADGSYASVKPGKLGKIKGIEPVKRSEGGAISELVIQGTKNTIKVISEYNVRYILRNESTEIIKNNGEKGTVSTLLPSSFLAVVIEGDSEGNNENDINADSVAGDEGDENTASSDREETEEVKSYRLIGGGYGHGIGMSQNGAKGMGEAGYAYDEILKFFYSDIEITTMNEG